MPERHECPLGKAVPRVWALLGLTLQPDASQYSRRLALRSTADTHSLLESVGGAYMQTCSDSKPSVRHAGEPIVITS